MRAWLTQDSLPTTRKDYVLTLPDDEGWKAQFLGAFLLLAHDKNWEQFGTLTPLEMADEWLELFLLFEEEGQPLIPVGTILPYAGESAPSGFLPCRGDEFNRADFADLFDVIGVIYGDGNGTTTANLPNLQFRFPVGADDIGAPFFELGNSGGESEVTLTLGEIPAHTHVQDTHNHTQNSHNHTQDTHNHTQNSHNHTQDTHNHTQNSHSHTLVKQGAHGTVFVDATSLFALSNLTNSGSESTNTTVAVNQTTVATNQATTPTNQTTVATNQNSGGGEAHNNIPPYLAINYIIKY